MLLAQAAGQKTPRRLVGSASQALLLKDHSGTSSIVWRKGMFVPSDWPYMTKYTDKKFCRTLVYVEGDASMGQYTDADGKPRTALNILQSESTSPSFLDPR